MGGRRGKTLAVAAVEHLGRWHPGRDLPTVVKHWHVRRDFVRPFGPTAGQEVVPGSDTLSNNKSSVCTA